MKVISFRKPFDKFFGLIRPDIFEILSRRLRRRDLVSRYEFSSAEVIPMKGMLNGLLAVISLLVAAGTFYFYTQSGDNKLYLVGSVIFLIIGIGLGGLFLSGRVNKTEDIHITE
jgi:uncharacterized membrane protein YbhN (UPF0104 family)